ncbi:MAG: hypothetical protein ACI9X0_002394 [Kiritimatiellia bacterium]|jgi:hypothetical protein
MKNDRFANSALVWAKCVALAVSLVVPGLLHVADAQAASPYLTTPLRQLNPSSHRTCVIISEIMYNAPGTNDGDFVEVFNTRPVDVDISGWRISGDTDYTFPSNTILSAREFRVIAQDPAYIIAEHGITNVLGPLSSGLPGNAGTIRLRNHMGASLLEVNYEDTTPWPLAADGAGHSLTLACPDFGEGFVDAWAASTFVGGSPGVADPETPDPLDAVMINEILAHTDEPQFDYVELFNSGPPIDISGCTLRRGTGTNSFVIPPGTLLLRGGFALYSQTHFGFNIRSEGDEILLGNPAGTRVFDAIRIPAQINGVSVGRYPDGAPDFHALAAISPGTANAATSLRIEDVVINEIMYSPISADDDDEYVELFNRGSNAVDISHWRFTDGISFTVPVGIAIPANGTIVIARDAARLIARYPQLNTANTLGNYNGSLSGRGERLVLSRPDNINLPNQDFVTVDEVTYNDGARWGEWSDGGGSSLELIDPHSDNRFAMNWAGSDETGKAPWTEVEYTDTVDQGSSTPNEMRLMFLQGGECLIDDVELINTNTATTYLSYDFEAGLGSWSTWGNHSRSDLETAEGASGTRSLHVRASGPGNLTTWADWGEAFYNHIRVPLSSSPAIGSSITLKAKVRWLAGWPRMAMALQKYYFEASVAMEIPHDLGSPGQVNSRFQNNAGPAIADVTHSPVLPQAGEDAVVTCRLSDPDGIASARLSYRLDPSAILNVVNMHDDGLNGDSTAGDGSFSGVIPGQSVGTRVAFFVTAADASATNRFPIAQAANSPALEGLIRFGQTLPNGIIGNYVMWMTDANAARWTSLPGGKYSNEPQDLTFVYAPYRVIYATSGRYRGLWRGYGSPINSGAYAIELSEERFQGQVEFKMDQPGQSGGDATRLGEHFCFWVANEIDVPGPRVEYARLNVNGTDRGLLHDLQTPSRDFAKSWFNDPDPQVYKHVGWVGDHFAEYKNAAGDYKQSRYRWIHRKRSMDAPNDDFSVIFGTAAAAATLDNDDYEARIDAVVDMRGWASFFAICGATRAWDHYGYSYGHNSFAYMPRTGGSSIFVYDMDHSLSGGVSLFPGGAWPIPVRMFNQPRFRRVYWSVLQDIVDGPFAHPGTFFDSWFAAFGNNDAVTAAPTALKNWVVGAKPQIESQLASVASGFAITTSGGNNFSANSTIITLEGNAPVKIASFRVNGIPNAVSYPTVTTWRMQLGLAAGTNLLTVTGYDWRGELVAQDTITVTQLATAPSPLGQLVISEIMYNPIQSGEEYIEIFNRSATDTFDLRGWRLNGVGHTFDGASLIGPGEYKLLAENMAAYQYAYGNAEHVLGDYAGDLDNGGETISLLMPIGTNSWQTVDEVRYDNDTPWPTPSDGHGRALQLIDIDQDNNRVGNWGAIPTILEPAWRFFSITGNASPVPYILGDAKVQMYLSGAGTVLVDSVSLVFGTVAESGSNLLANGDFESPLSGPWSLLGNHSGSAIVSTDAYAGTGALQLSSSGPGQVLLDSIFQARSLTGYPNADLTLSYWYFDANPGLELTAAMTRTDLSDSHSTATPTASDEGSATPGTTNALAATRPALPLLWINEIMPTNTSTLADNVGDYDPWIELINLESNSIDLAEFRLSDDYALLAKWAFPSGTVINAGERLLIWADNETGESMPGFLHAAFRLSPVGGTVFLARAELGSHTIVDYVDYGAIEADASYGSTPEGDPHARQVFDSPTPGAPNNPTSVAVMVAINEWMPDNKTTLADPSDGQFDDWFELVNLSSAPVNIGQYFLSDDLLDTDKFEIPGGVVIGPKAFMLIWADNDTDANAPGSDVHVNFSLSKAGDQLGLFARDGSLVDAVTFSALGPDASAGRWPDGSPNLYPMMPPTPGSTNAVLLIVAAQENASPEGFRINWMANSGSVYRIEAKDSLMQTNWIYMDELTAHSQAISYTDTNAPTQAVRFYRISAGD